MSRSPLVRILYVEDDPDIQQVAQLAPEVAGGFTIETCSSGQEAIDKASGFAPQMILIDVMMPGMDGPTTLAQLRRLEEERRSGSIRQEEYLELREKLFRP